MYLMRTTVTLEPETERLLREAMHQRGQSFKETLNQAVIRGLTDLLCDIDETSFSQQSFPMGLRTGYDPAHLNSLNDDMEVDAFLALSRRLSEQPSSEWSSLMQSCCCMRSTQKVLLIKQRNNGGRIV